VPKGRENKRNVGELRGACLWMLGDVESDGSGSRVPTHTNDTHVYVAALNWSDPGKGKIDRSGSSGIVGDRRGSYYCRGCSILLRQCVAFSYSPLAIPRPRSRSFFLISFSLLFQLLFFTTHSDTPLSLHFYLFRFLWS
jgi:hypothetical protein